MTTRTHTRTDTRADAGPVTPRHGAAGPLPEGVRVTAETLPYAAPSRHPLRWARTVVHAPLGRFRAWNIRRRDVIDLRDHGRNAGLGIRHRPAPPPAAAPVTRPGGP